MFEAKKYCLKTERDTAPEVYERNLAEVEVLVKSIKHVKYGTVGNEDFGVAL